MRSVLNIPGGVQVKGRAFVLPVPTAGDVARVHERMRQLAQRDVVSPIAYVAANADALPPVLLAEAVRAAVAMGSGGGAEPTREAVFRAYDTLDGVRFRLWYYARKAEPGLAREAVDALVGEDDVYDVADALVAAHDAGADGPKAPPGGGS